MQLVEHGDIDFVRLADEAEVDDFLDIGIRIDHGARHLARLHHVAVLAAQPDRLAAGGVDVADDLLVDRAGQHHFDDLDGLGVGDAQAGGEFRFDAELLEHGLDLRAAAVHHDRIDRGLLEQHDVAGEIARGLLLAHGVAAVFDHDDLLVVALHVRQRLRQDARLLERVDLWGFAIARPSVEMPQGSSRCATMRQRFLSSNRRAIAARSSANAGAVMGRGRQHVGVGGRALGERGLGLGDALGKLGRLHGVALGQHDLMADGHLAERVEHRLVGLLEAVAGVDQHVDAGEVGAAAQVGVDHLGPGRDLGLGGRGIAVARHVHHVEGAAAGEEDQFLGAAGRARGARQLLAAGERVDQARLADIGAAGERDLGAAHRRQRYGRAGGGDKVPVAGEQLAAGLDLVGG